ncbi:MAG: hypothetical protein ACK5XN_27800 [Bacteroidota bacterium]|jgi:hypothetical protein
MFITQIQSNLILPRPGVYRVYATGFGCRRLYGVDESGLLYIGEATNIQRRLSNLKSACNTEMDWPWSHRKEKHVFGGKLFFFMELNPVLFPDAFHPSNLSVEFEYCDNHHQREKELIMEYRRLYGELPPYNHAQ